MQLAACLLLPRQVRDRGPRESQKIKVPPDSPAHQAAGSLAHQVVLPEADNQEQPVAAAQAEPERKVQVDNPGQEVDLANPVRKNIIPANQDPAAVQAANQVPLVQVEALQLLNNPSIFGC